MVSENNSEQSSPTAAPPKRSTEIPPEHSRELSPQRVHQLRELVTADPAHRVAMNAVTTTGINDVALNRQALVALDESTEIKLDSLPVTDQKQSGRCWMFGSLNSFRHGIARDLEVEDFQFSHSYLQFFDLLEKSNHTLQAIAAIYSGALTPTGCEPLAKPGHLNADTQRVVDTLYEYGVSDGSWWGGFAHLVAKYGVVPSYVMPETVSSSKTRALSRDINTVVRKATVTIADAIRTHTSGAEADSAGADSSDGATPPEPFDAKGIIAQALRDIHRILCIHIGVPPTEFVWQYRTKNNDFVRKGTYTPQQFAEEYLPDDLEDYVQIVIDPRPHHEKNKKYTVELCNAVWGKNAHTYINVEPEVMHAACVASLEKGKPVPFSCDVMRQFRMDLGVWDDRLFELDEVYGTGTALSGGLSPAERFELSESAPTHLMSLTGIDFAESTDAGRIVRRWRVENSWGSTFGKDKEPMTGNGYAVMADSWFRNNVYQAVISPQIAQEILPEAAIKAIDSEPIVLPVTDLMY